MDERTKQLTRELVKEYVSTVGTLAKRYGEEKSLRIIALAKTQEWADKAILEVQETVRKSLEARAKNHDAMNAVMASYALAVGTLESAKKFVESIVSVIDAQDANK